MEAGDVYYCDRFPFQETRLRNKGSRPVLLLDEVGHNKFLVMMLTTGDYVDEDFDVVIEKSDIVKGKFVVKKNTSRARVYIIRTVKRNQLKNYKFTISNTKVSEIIDTMYEFEKRRFENPRNFKNWCTMYNIKKIRFNPENRLVYTLEDIDNRREATCVDISIAVRRICQTNDIQTNIGYIKWIMKNGEEHGHMFSMFEERGRIKCFHYIGDGYCNIDDNSYVDFDDAIEKTSKLFEKEIRYLHGYKEQYHTILTREDNIYIDSLEEKITLKELFKNILHDSVPILEDLENSNFTNGLEIVD